MRTGNGLVVLTVCMLAVGVLSKARSDIGSPRRPQLTEVSLESETVNITLSEGKASVEAVFLMRHNGRPSNEPMGFPLGVYEKALNDFRVTVDGEAVKSIKGQKSRAGGRTRGSSIEAGSYRFTGPYKQWKVWTVPMLARQQRTVRVNYWVKPATLKDDKEGDLLFYCYTLCTGASWRGKIKQALIRVTLDGVKPDRIMRRGPKGYVISQGGRVTTWTMKNFEPTQDIKIAFRKE